MTTEANNLSPAQAASLPRASRAVFAVPLNALIEDGFDYKAFKKSVKADKSFSPEQKKHIISSFAPKAPVLMHTSQPVSGIGAHLLAGASRDMDSPSANKKSENEVWNNGKKELAKDDPISQMWQEVWQQTLVHYAAEATEYEQTMTNKGRPVLDDPIGFPAKSPPIHLVEGMNIINASAGIDLKTDLAEANVTKGFMDKLDAKQQRAILFHEAQHSFDAVLSGKTPYASMLKHGIAGRITSNHTTRSAEYRADEHAARMGMASELESAFNRMETDMGQYYVHNAKVLHHLHESGFSFDVDAIRDMKEQVKVALKTGTFEAQLEADFDPLAPQPFLPLPNPVKLAKKALEKAGEVKDKVEDDIFTAQVNQLNASISDASAYITRRSQPRQAAESAPAQSHGGLAKTVGKVVETIEEARRTHPKHTDRIKQMKKVEPCQGCADPSPFASHGDRVKAISPTGIQGITR